MCGRFSLKSTIHAIEDEFEIDNIEIPIQPRYNIAPSQNVPVVVYEGKRYLKLFKWGLVPFWAKDPSIGNKMINARAESLTTKISFKKLFSKNRCIVIADGFYEWEKGTSGKNPYYFCMKTKKPFGFAGLWSMWNSPEGEIIYSCTIITVEPNRLVEKIHNRMPAILNKSDYQLWLNYSYSDEKSLLKLLKPYPDEEMTYYKVSKLVNSPSNDNPDCIKPAE